MLVWVFLGLGSILYGKLIYLSSGESRQPFLHPWIIRVPALDLDHCPGVQSRNFQPSIESNEPAFHDLILVCAAVYHGLFRNPGRTSGWFLPALVAIWIIVWVGAPRFGLILSILLVIGIAIFHQQFVSLVMVGDNA